ncbi:acyltransferase family protein [Agrilactobacillus yilanensis]|uniref:Acyltransferase family protein n=1 Tax=Agrilactobacillus yilanensis TaxID=2485997 RepID=A0ABW4J5X7_9LACO|nr:acyltransferase [Agrilactobacillus yilanensis]
MTKERDYSLDFVRVVAALFVITVHVMANSTKTNDIAYNINLVASSGIFMFIILSGCTNSLRFQNQRRWPKQTQLFKSAFTKLLIPYLIWTLIYRTINGYLHQDVWWGLTDWPKLGMDILTGGAWYHLYFMVILIYLYLIYGLLYRWLKAYRLPTLLFFGLSPIAITYIVGLVKMPAALNNILYSSPLNWWGLPFILGILWALHFKLKIWGRNLKLLGLVTIVGGGYFYLYTITTGLFEHSQRIAVYNLMMYLREGYAFLSILFFYALGYILYQYLPFLKKPMQRLGSHVYTIYFCHPVIICITDQLQQTYSFFGSHETGPLLVKLGITIVGAVVLAYLIDGVKLGLKRLIQQPKLAIKTAQ